MTSWHTLPRAAFDLETTGRDPLDARIVTASIVVVNGRSEILHTKEWLVNPGVPIPVEASEIHGIYTAQAQAEGIDAATAVAEISAYLADLFQTMPVMAFNAAYDFTVLDREAKRHGVAPLAPAPVIDPYIMDKQVDKYRRGKRNLSVMSEFYGVPLLNAHTSAADAAATIGIADALATKYPKLQVDPLELHGAQVSWAAEQAAGLQEFFRRKDSAAVVNGEWPVRG
ncbi:3'-5' exonuclease [Paeniglutamicibacter kerguelensis]|uniref:DNA polymerase-3 subunit epsilon n=1 Tax=Paeniglutamicibacter kerguelensis TaxID=254788 RepID=A0ABS4XEP6_9MICC|nr:3'-5' exonuclease [Paeniglutamicibacter kerguelensis]MBP2386723.1 DNA polymerase-3 subunit epsilon [Paeniglutamicibacter kerguelensis]